MAMRLHCTGWCAQDVTSAVRSCHVLGHSVNRSRPKPFQSEKHTHAGDCPQFQFGHRGSRVITLAASTVAVGQEKPPEAPQDKYPPVEGVTALKVTNNITCLRGVCNERLKYEIEYALRRGTTENSYLIAVPDSDHKILIDVPFKAFAKGFMSCLEQETDVRQISHIVLTHVGPNRVSTLLSVLDKALQGRPAGSMKLVLSNPALKVLQAGMQGAGKPDLLSGLDVIVVKSGDEQIDITDKYSLEATLTPTPRWPDLMCVFEPKSKVMFTSKLFSAHVSPELLKASSSAFDVGSWEAYGEHWKYFFDCMLAPVAKQAVAALDKLPISATPRAAMGRPAAFLDAIGQLWGAAVSDIVAGSKQAPDGKITKAPRRTFAYALAPQHGPVVKTTISQLVYEYRKWAEQQVAAMRTSNVAVMYASAYGNTAALAQAITRGVTKGGVAVNTINLELVGLEEVAEAVKQSDAFILGSPTLGGHMPTQVQVALGNILRQSKARELPCGVFGSFGWSGEAVDEMESRLKDAGFAFAFKPIRVKFKPTAKDLVTCEQAGRDLAVQVKRRLKNKEKSTAATSAAEASQASGRKKAMGRVVGSLSVVTAADEDLKTGMLASWISQASFDPPGVTVSVKKDRVGMETLLHSGNKFSISMLPEGADKKILKVMSTPHQPGEDRLEGIEIFDSEVSGAPILKAANAYMDCEVISRMEAGDHWVIYAKVEGGKVLDDAALTSVCHRKVGNHY
eukprot:jgi/Chrzof1/11015/Cz05g20140.t1